MKRPFTEEDPAVYHHNHDSGAYIGTVHNSENFQAKLPNGLCAVSYDLSKHDKHLLIEGFHDNLIKKFAPVVTSSGSFIGMMINKILKITSLTHFRDGKFEELVREINSTQSEFLHVREYLNLVPEALNIILKCEFALPSYSNVDTAKKEFASNAFPLPCYKRL